MTVKRIVALALVLLLALACTAAWAEDKLITRLSISGGSGDGITLKVGAKKSIAVVVLPRDATNKTLRWESSNTNVATVDSGGVVTAVGEGKTIITCRATDGSGLYAQLVATVESPHYAACLRDVRVGHNSIGSPKVYVSVQNMDTKNDIIAFVFATRCYDAFGTPLRAHGFGDYEQTWIWQEGRIKPGKSTSVKDNWCWTLYGYDTAYQIDVWLIKYRMSDGTTCTIPKEDYVVWTWKAYE